MSVGMPQTLLLHEFGSHVWSVFGGPPYQVGSSLAEKRNWYDVDVRMILSDEEYEAWGLGDPKRPHNNAKWVSLCLAYSALGKFLTGLPIDFQIQQRSHANREFEKQPRSALGIVPLRMMEYAQSVNPVMKTECAWLIEFPIHDGQVQYYGRTINGVGITPENMDAIRYARKEDAESVCEILRPLNAAPSNPYSHGKVVEHSWG